MAAELDPSERRAFVPKALVMPYFTAPQRSRYWRRKKRRAWVKWTKLIYGKAVMPALFVSRREARRQFEDVLRVLVTEE